jgi:phosphatidate cytidylyltransferase
VSGEKAQNNDERQKAGWTDLGPRLVSGLILALAVLLITWAGPVPFALLLSLGGMILGWEWGHMVRGADIDELTVLTAITVVAALWLGVFGHPGTGFLLLLVGPTLKFFLHQGPDIERFGLSLFGVPYIGLALLALVWLRGDGEYGWWAIIYLFVVVWSVDIFAYFTGRSLGGPKLAPRISPKKTWSGFLGGVLMGALAGALVGHFMGGTSPFMLGAVALGLGVVAQMGDLFESVFKRRMGVKDASNLIPGHGGLFDRVDGLIAAALAACLFGLLFDPLHPARALLIWGQGG